MSSKRRILLGVTSDISLTLMQGFPEFLRDSGWEVHVVSAPGRFLTSLSSVPGIVTHAVEMVRDPAPLADLRSFLAWVRLLRKVRPSTVSVGTPKAGLIGGLAAFFTRVPRRAYLLRGLRMETTRGIRRRAFTLLEKLAMSVAHDVIAVSPSLRQRAIDLRLAKPDKIVVLGAGSSNGVDCEAYSGVGVDPHDASALAESLGLTPGVPVVGFVGRLTADKGLAVLARAREALAAESIDYQLLVVGGIDEGQDQSVLSQVMSNGRPAIVIGNVIDPRPYYRLMDLLCLPTFREGFPNVVLEASASGIPTVTTDATGAVDSVVDGKSGVIVATGSSAALANGIALLLSDPDMRARMGSFARDHVAATYDRADVQQRYETFYRSSARARRRASQSNAHRG